MVKNKRNLDKKVGRPAKIKFRSPKGMHDILPKDQEYFQKIFDVCKDMAEFYGFGRIETPILEQADLFTKGVGQATEIVEKQMYVLKTKSGDDLALRPEGTAGVARAFVQNGMESWPRPVKLWYFGPFFRHENPQSGRFRQFWQFGFEVLGARDPVIDVQIIQIFLNILGKLKIKDLLLQINSIGEIKCRSRYKKVLVKYLRSCQKNLCLNCKRRIKQNPFRVLDCKNTKCKKVVNAGPQIMDYLCKACRAHFKQVLEFLDGLEIPYSLNPYLVRGLDYYTQTVFEIFIAKPSEDLDNGQIALAGGGRYDELVGILGSPDIAGCGAAAGIERIAQIMKDQEFKFPSKKKPQIFLAQLGILSKTKGLQLFEQFRKAGVPVFETFSKDSLRAQMERANKLGAKYALILGQKEVMESKVILRDMQKGTQKTLKLDKIIQTMKKKIK